MPWRSNKYKIPFGVLLGSFITSAYIGISYYMEYAVLRIPSVVSMQFTALRDRIDVDKLSTDNSDSDWGFHVRITPQTTYYISD